MRINYSSSIWPNGLCQYAKLSPAYFVFSVLLLKRPLKVRVRLLLHPVDTSISMAVTSFYLRSSLETATQHCDSRVIYYNRLHWPREFGFGSPHSVPSNFLSAAVAAGLAPTEITCLYLPIQSESAKESLFAPFQKNPQKKTFTFCPLESSFFYLFLKDSALFIWLFSLPFPSTWVSRIQENTKTPLPRYHYERSK